MTLSQSNTYQDRIQHLEYNEAKPTYERCSKDKMKCDGYLPPKPPKPPRRRAKPKAAPAKLAVVPLGYPIHNVSLAYTTKFWNALGPDLHFFTPDYSY